MNDRYILEAFWGTEANCVVTAFIKSVLTLKNGTTALRQYRRDNYLFLEMPDGRCWRFTDAEVRELNRKNNLVFRHPRNASDQIKLDRLKTKVHNWYAVIVRNLQVQGYEKKELTASQAKHLLNKEGMRTSDFHHLMGLERTASVKLSSSGLPGLRHKKGILLYNKGHIVAAASGWFDRDREAVSLMNNWPVARNRKLTYYFQVIVSRSVVLRR
jgi:hypothetical protein